MPLTVSVIVVARAGGAVRALRAKRWRRGDHGQRRAAAFEKPPAGDRALAHEPSSSRECGVTTRASRMCRIYTDCATSMDRAFLEGLRRIVGDAGVLHDPLDLLTYECDALAHLRETPAAVVLPSSAAEVQAVVRLCARTQVPFVARGHGTGLSGGALPVAGGVVIALSRLNRVLDVDIANQRVTVEPGVTNLEITRQVAPFGYYYAPDPSSQQVCSIGGNVAENSGGAHCLKYGFTVHHVLGVEAVLPDGEIVHLGGALVDTPGPDLLGLLVGSEGTLAVVTQRHRADPAAARNGADAARRVRHDRRRRRRRVRHHRRRHHSGGGRDDGLARHPRRRSRGAPELPRCRHHPDRRARRPRRRGLDALRDRRGHLPAARRDDDRGRADRRAARAHLARPQGGIRRDGPRLAELLRPGRRRPADAAAGGADSHPRARSSAPGFASATSFTPATATCIR